MPEEPSGFFRSTGYGIDYLFRKVSFQIEELAATSGFGVTLFAQLNYFLRKFLTGPLISLVDAAIIFNNPLVPVVDLGGMRDERFTWMHLVLARKPDVS